MSSSGPEDGDRERPPAREAPGAPAVGTTATLQGRKRELAYARTLAGGSEPAEGGAARLAPGAPLGRYEIRGVLGEGGMGVVYAAYDSDLERKVALKVLHAGERISDAARARLLREARAMARLSHPNVITVYEVGTAGDTDFVAMELVEGGTLADWLSRGPRPWRDVVEMLLRAGRGLAAAHEAGLVHRDFKPANVLVDGGGRVLVTDFGLARSRRSDPEALAVAETSAPNDGQESGLAAITRAGAVVGTPAYMAPEQHAGGEPDARTDQFGFCVALYEGLYGRRPFEGDTPGELRERVTAGELAPSEWRARIPGRLRRAVRRGLSAAQRDRHPSMEALLRELEKALARPRRSVVALAALAVLAGGGAFVALGGDEPPSAGLCGDADEELADAWNGGVRDELRAALGAGDEGSGGEIVIERLDEYAAAWKASYEELCGAAFDRGEVAEEDYYRARRCLLQRRSELGSLVEVLKSAGPRARGRAAMAAQGLPPIAACEDLESLRAGVAPPEDEATRRVVDALRDELAELRALQEAGRAHEAEAPAEAAVARARELDYPPILAEALYRHGEIQLALAGAQAAREALEEAEFVAEVEGHDEIRARALVARADTESRFSSNYPEIRKIAERARAAAERYGRDGRLEARLDRALARVHREQGRYDEAEAALEAALARYRSVEGPGSVRAVSALGALAVLHFERGAFEEALELGQEARATGIETVGADHPRVVEQTLAVAEYLMSVGRYDEAKALYDEVEARWEVGAAEEILRVLRRLSPAAQGGSRDIEGRVVDSRGDPVAGAEVVVGLAVLGNGKFGNGYRGGHAKTWAAQRTFTDEEGRFRLEGQLTSRLVALAEHDDRGRSLPLRIPSGPGREVLLELRPFGRVEGEVRVTGEPPPFVTVLAWPGSDTMDGAGNSQVLVRPGERFVFERLAAAEHMITASAVRGSARDSTAAELVRVRPGETVQLDLMLDRRGVDLEVQVTGPGGDAVPSAQVLLLAPGTDYETVGEVRADLGGFQDIRQLAFSAAGRPASLGGVALGDHALCVIPLPIDLKEVEKRMEADLDDEDLAVHCQELNVTVETGRETLRVQAPSVPTLQGVGARDED